MWEEGNVGRIESSGHRKYFDFLPYVFGWENGKVEDGKLM